jgi:hypothetical protein
MRHWASAGFWVVWLTVVSLLPTVGFAEQPAGVVLTQMVTLASTPYKLNRKSGAYEATVTLTNKSKTKRTVYGPITLVVSGVSGSDMQLLDSAGNTDDGKPYVMAAGPSMALPAGKKLKIKLRITNPSRKKLKIKHTAYGLLAQNRAPTAIVGSSLTTNVGSTVTLDGSQSSDPDGNPLIFSWVLTNPPGSTTALLEPSSAQPRLTPDVEGDYQLQLVVNDGVVNSAPVTLTVHANAASKLVNGKPTAKLITATSATKGEVVALDGSPSSDPDGDRLQYIWTVTDPASKKTTLADAAKVNFTAELVGDYTISLVVSDGSLSSVAATTKVSVANNVVNGKPTAKLTAPASANKGEVISLDGSPSSDPDGDALQYIWTVTDPASKTTTLADTAMVNFTAETVGDYTISLVVSDGSLSSVAATAKVSVTGPPTVKITAPSSLITVGASPISVAGTVSDREASMSLNGKPLTASNGNFTADVSLQEGHNVIVIRAVDKSGREATDSITVSLDKTPPYVTIESVTDGTTVWSDLVDITGQVNDIVRGTIAEDQANVTVTVNSDQATAKTGTVLNRSYAAEKVKLQPGENTIQVHASDAVGNVGHAQIKLTYKVPGSKRVEYVSGDNQTGVITTSVANPLKVKLLDEKGEPVASQEVVFRVTQGDGEVGGGTADPGPATLVSTNSDGIASMSYKLGTRAGVGNHRVRATAVGYDGEAIFTFSATTAQGNKVSINSGNNQRGGLGQPLPLPLVVVVTDQGSNVVQGAQVEFGVTQGSGKFDNGKTTLIATTDSDGRASAEMTLGSEVGMDVHRATAKLVGTSLNAGFTASALVAGDPGNTKITGVVLDNQDHPLPGVSVRVDGTSREAQTDEQGHFTLTSVPIGPVRLMVDGSTTTVAGEFPTLPFNIVTIPGAENSLPAPIYLVKLDTESAVTVGQSDVPITLDKVPGFKLDVKAGSVTFPDGKKTGKLSVTPVNADKIPMPPPNGMQPQFIVTIQPVGTKFDPPARLTLPNVDGHKPGAEVEMYSFDHDLEEFVSIGLGTVSADGSVIQSNTGVGVIKAGWHCGSQPGGQGCASNCGGCKKCDGNCNCVADDSQTPLDWLQGDCKKTVCSNGGTSTEPDDSDVPTGDSNKCKACQAGGVVNKPNGTRINACESCKGGQVEKAPDKILSSTEYSWAGLQVILKGINEFLDLLGSNKKLPVVGVKFSTENKEVCCPEKNGAMTKEITNTGSVVIPFKSGEFRPTIPPWSGDYTVTIFGRDIGVQYGVVFSAAINFNAQLSRAKRECQNDNCWGGGVSADASADGGLYASMPNPALPPECGPAKDRACDVVRLTGKGVLGLNVQTSVNCEQIEAKVGHNGFSVVGEFAVAEGSWYEVSVAKTIPLLQPGVVAGPLQIALPK